MTTKPVPLKYDFNELSLICVYHKDDILGVAFVEDADTGVETSPFEYLAKQGHLQISREVMGYSFAQVVTQETEATEEFPYLQNPSPSDSSYINVAYVRLTRLEIPSATLTENLTSPELTIVVDSTADFPYECVGLLGSELVRIRKTSRESFEIQYPSDGLPLSGYGSIVPPNSDYFVYLKNESTGDVTRTWKEGTTLYLYSYGPAFEVFVTNPDTLNRSTVRISRRLGESNKFANRVFTYIPEVYWSYDTAGKLSDFMNAQYEYLYNLEKDLNLLNDIDYNKAKEACLPYLVRNMYWETKSSDPDLWRWQARYIFPLYKKKGITQELKSLLKLLEVDFSYYEKWRDAEGELTEFLPEFLTREYIAVLDWDFYNSSVFGEFSIDSVGNYVTGGTPSLEGSKVQDLTHFFTKNQYVTLNDSSWKFKDSKGQEFSILDMTETLPYEDSDFRTNSNIITLDNIILSTHNDWAYAYWKEMANCTLTLLSTTGTTDYFELTIPNITVPSDLWDSTMFYEDSNIVLNIVSSDFTKYKLTLGNSVGTVSSYSTATYLKINFNLPTGSYTLPGGSFTADVWLSHADYDPLKSYIMYDLYDYATVAPWVRDSFNANYLTNTYLLQSYSINNTVIYDKIVYSNENYISINNTVSSDVTEIVGTSPSSVLANILDKIPYAGSYMIYKSDQTPTRVWRAYNEGTTRAPELSDSLFIYAKTDTSNTTTSIDTSNPFGGTLNINFALTLGNIGLTKRVCMDIYGKFLNTLTNEIVYHFRYWFNNISSTATSWSNSYDFGASHYVPMERQVSVSLTVSDSDVTSIYIPKTLLVPITVNGTLATSVTPTFTCAIN